MSPWGWRPIRTQGIWQHGSLWLKPLAALSPWATAVLALMTMYVVGDTLTASRGTLFDLPVADVSDDVPTSLVVLIMPLRNEAMVFFDDARYSLNDEASVVVLGERLSERMARTRQKTVLVLADRRISWDDLSRFSVVARASGVERMLFANHRAEERDE